VTLPRWLRHPLTFWVTWHSLALIGFFALVGVRLGVPPWRFSSADLFRAAVLGVGYLLGALLLHLLGVRGRKLGPGEVLLGGLAGFGLVFFSFLATNLQISRFALSLAFAGGVCLLLVGFLVTRYRLVLLAGLATAVLGTLAWTAESGVAFTALPKARATSAIASSLHAVRATFNRNYIPRSASHFTGGGITPVGRGHLIVTSDGNLLSVDWNGDGSPVIGRLTARAPLNRDEFAAAAGAGSYVSWFRSLDVIAREEAGLIRIFVSHHRWKPAEKCFVVRVSMLEGDPSAPLVDVARGEWKTVYDTEPCLPLVTSEPRWPFRGMEGGGRMAFLDQHRLLLTVGDQGFNGVDFESEPDRVQDPTAAYGKTVLIDLRDGSWRPYSIGHRNAQGLVIDEAGTIWLTEHGPQGGDELNRLEDGGNYGWPAVTYGTDYGKSAWPRNPRQGRHDGFVEPVYAWVPSIGASSIIVVRGDLFKAWAGDLLIGTLVSETLLRVRIDEGRVRLVEPIAIGERVRDLVEDPSGRIILLTDSYSIVTLEPSQMAFAMCAGCHTTTGKPGPGLGPDLAGVVGRDIASAAGFGYSEGLRKVEGVWTDEQLDRFLAEPQAFAPGTSMVMEGIADPSLRQKIVEYLKSR